MRHASLCIAAIVSTCAASACAENLLVNGSFESWPTTVPSYVLLPAGSRQLAGWTVTGVSIDLVGSWQQADGLLSIDLDGSPGPGGLAQTVATKPGQWYDVSFLLSGNPECGNPTKSVQVSAAGDGRTFSFNTTGHTFSSMGWEPQTWCFQAVATTTTIAFTSLSPNGTDCGAAIDGVVVTAGGPPILGDLDCNGAVDAADLAQLLGAWGRCVECVVCKADLNGDCAVDAADLAILLGAWTQ